MRTFDFSPLFRSTVGFDRMARILDSALNLDEGTSTYPPYNIEKKSDTTYVITMAVAGFSFDDLTVTIHESMLSVAGKAKPEPEGVTYIHRGIAGRAFERRFQLADSIKIVGASLENGLLNIELMREIPESLKPRTIKIQKKEDQKILV